MSLISNLRETDDAKIFRFDFPINALLPVSVKLMRTLATILLATLDSADADSPTANATDACASFFACNFHRCQQNLWLDTF